MGKTTSVVSLCKVIADERIDKSLLITCERIEQLGEIKEAMISAGVPVVDIGLIHRSKDYRSRIKPDELELAAQFRFLLATQQRVKLDSLRGSYPERLMEFRNRRRDLVLWDESLIASQGHCVGRQEILRSIAIWLVGHRAAVAAGQPSEQFRDSYEEMRGFLSQVEGILLAADDAVVQMPALDLPNGRAAQVIRNIVGERTPDDQVRVEQLIQLVEYARRGDIRVAKIKGDYALLQFEQTIDPAFNKVVILDASAKIRKLATYDAKLEIQPLPITKRYSNVEIRWVNAKASRNGFSNGQEAETNFRSYVEHLRTGMRERYDHDWEGTIFCHQDREGQIATELERLVHETGWGVKPIHLLHWGQHRASNRYKEAKWTFLWGVNYLPRSALAAAVVGQTGRLDYRFLDREIDALQESELAESIYPAVSRGNSRTVNDGEAGAQLVELVLPEREMRNVRPLLEMAMPGVKISEVKPAYFQAMLRSNASSYIEMADRIAEFLKNLPEEMVKIAKRKVNEALGLNANRSVYRNAERYLSQLVTAWRSKGRSFVRNS
jgi:hypothetical protein